VIYYDEGNEKIYFWVICIGPFAFIIKTNFVNAGLHNVVPGKMKIMNQSFRYLLLIEYNKIGKIVH